MLDIRDYFERPLWTTLVDLFVLNLREKSYSHKIKSVVIWLDFHDHFWWSLTLLYPAYVKKCLWILSFACTHCPHPCLEFHCWELNSNNTVAVASTEIQITAECSFWLSYSGYYCSHSNKLHVCLLLYLVKIESHFVEI